MADTPDRGPLPLTNDMADRIDWQKGDGWFRRLSRMPKMARF
jgi:hypothetical protein